MGCACATCARAVISRTMSVIRPDVGAVYQAVAREPPDKIRTVPARDARGLPREVGALDARPLRAADNPVARGDARSLVTHPGR